MRFKVLKTSIRWVLAITLAVGALSLPLWRLCAPSAPLYGATSRWLPQEPTEEPGKNPAPLVEIKEDALWRRALKLHDEALVIDSHCDTPMVMMLAKTDIGTLLPHHDVDLPRLKQGGVDGIFFAIYTPNSLDNKKPALYAHNMLEHVIRQISRYRSQAEIAFSPEDILRISDSGKRAILLSLENGGALEGNVENLRRFHRRGVRYITLTHMDNNALCDSSTAARPRWNGLSPLGREMIREMNRLGIMVDVSHVSDQTFWDILETSQAPVFASHSSARALCGSPRNLTDEMIIALARRGGVIQIAFCSFFLDETFKTVADSRKAQLKRERTKIWSLYAKEPSAMAAAMAKLRDDLDPPPPPLSRLLDHIHHVVKLAGPDAAGLGSDFDGSCGMPEGLRDVSAFPLITYSLLKKGYREEEIKKILGLNFMRYFTRVRDTALKLQAKNRP